MPAGRPATRIERETTFLVGSMREIDRPNSLLTQTDPRPTLRPADLEHGNRVRDGSSRRIDPGHCPVQGIRDPDRVGTNRDRAGAAADVHGVEYASRQRIDFDHRPCRLVRHPHGSGSDSDVHRIGARIEGSHDLAGRESILDNVWSSPFATQTDPLQQRFRSGRCRPGSSGQPRSSWSMRETVPSRPFATHTAPAPTTTGRALPTFTVCRTVLVARSMRTTVWSSALITQTAPSPKASSSARCRRGHRQRDDSSSGRSPQPSWGRSRRVSGCSPDP